MGIWDDQVAQHPLLGRLNQLLDSWGDTLPGLADASSEVHEIQERVAHTLRALVGRVQAADPRMVTPEMLGEATPYLDRMDASRSAIDADQDLEGHLREANAALDSVLNAMRGWPPADGQQQLGALEGEVNAARTRMLQELEALSAQISSVTDASAERATALQTRLDELQGAIDAAKASTAQTTAEFQGQFSTAQQARLDENNALRQEWGDKFEEQRVLLLEQFTTFFEEQRQLAIEVLQELNAKQAQAEKVTEAIGIAGRAAGYKIDADQQRRSANWMRFFAVLALLAFAGMAIWGAEAASSNDEFNWGRFLAHALISAAFASAAAYLIIQSAHHRERERRARNLQIELATIDPFLALMPEEKQVEIKEKLAEAWFGRPITPIDESGGAGTASIPISEFIQAIIRLGSK